LRLRRAPELAFEYDESIARGERIERIIQELHDAAPPMLPGRAATTRRSEPVVLDQVRATVEAGSRFLITSHARPDGDSIGSQLALALALDRLGKTSRVVNRDRVPPQFTAFPGTDRVEVAGSVEGDFDALFVMECSDLSRPGVAGLARAGARAIVNIDHHEGNTNFGTINWFDAPPPRAPRWWPTSSTRSACRGTPPSARTSISPC